jgi:hypothetical protein
VGLAAVAGLLSLTGTASGGTAAPLLSKPEFLKRGNAICARATRAIDLAGQKAFQSPGNPTAREIAAFAKNVVVPAELRAVRLVRALVPPIGDERRVRVILDAAQTAILRVKANPSLLGRPNGSERANRLARAYGLVECAK